MPVTHSFNTDLAYGDAATAATSTTWTSLVGVTDIKPPKIDGEDVDISHLKSPNKFKQFDPGWANAGELEFTVQYDKTQTTAVYALFRTPKGFQVTFADGSKWKYDGYIKSWQDQIEKDGIVTQNLTIKISGQPGFTAGT
jgi:hypothetical protein